MNETNIRKIENFPDVFSIKDFAKYLGIGKNTAYAEVKSGAIKSFKLGNKILIPKAYIEEYVLTKCVA
jgi:excisionase family DNA binding protein